MLYQRQFHFMPHRIKIYLQAFFPHKFNRGNKIRISGNEHYLINNLFRGHRSHIKTDFHINTFLLEIRLVYFRIVQILLPSVK